MLRIVILNSDRQHPINSYLRAFQSEMLAEHTVDIVRTEDELSSGDLLFLISCNEKISPSYLKKFRYAMVLHASALPIGRGWSPHIWQIINGETEITLSLIEAQEEIDTGDIFNQLTFFVPRDYLYNEINHLLFLKEIDLMRFAIDKFDQMEGKPQRLDVKPTYFKKRKQSDSEIDPHKTLEEQFNLIRVCDPDRYPAFFYHQGSKFKLILEKF